MACVVDSCPVMEPGWTKVTGPSVWVTRCVEYDQIEPSHCATVLRTSYVIYAGAFIVGYCYATVCCYGTPTSEECIYPYVCP